LLDDGGLLTAGVAEQMGGFLVADDGASIVGVAGLEVYDGVGLLRSVAVAASLRGYGLGARLVRAALAAARQRGIRNVALLTETAGPFFSRLGFRESARERMDPRLLSSSEFTSPSCATALVMSMTLQDGEEAGS
jgi:amino-acid N-acetyltransferase